MYHYRVTDGYIVSRRVSKKFKEDKDVISYLKDVVPECNPICINEVDGNDLLEMTENMIDFEEDIIKCNWFMSNNKDVAIASAVIYILSNTKDWDVMDDADKFYGWINKIVR